MVRKVAELQFRNSRNDFTRSDCNTALTKSGPKTFAQSVVKAKVPSAHLSHPWTSNRWRKKTSYPENEWTFSPQMRIFMRSFPLPLSPPSPSWGEMRKIFSRSGRWGLKCHRWWRLQCWWSLICLVFALAHSSSRTIILKGPDAGNAQKCESTKMVWFLSYFFLLFFRPKNYRRRLRCHLLLLLLHVLGSLHSRTLILINLAVLCSFWRP